MARVSHKAARGPGCRYPDSTVREAVEGLHDVRGAVVPGAVAVGLGVVLDRRDERIDLGLLGRAEGTVKLSLLGADGGPKVGNDRRIEDRIRLLQGLATVSTGSVWGGFVQPKLNVTVPYFLLGCTEFAEEPRHRVNRSCGLFEAEGLGAVRSNVAPELEPG